jgi:hypothetical protein
MSMNTGDFLGGTSPPRNSSADPDFLKAALRRGATVYIGAQSDSVDLAALKSLLEEVFPFDDEYRHYQLIGPTVVCAHWFGFASRQDGLNILYPAMFLRELIAECFSLDSPDIPMDAVLAGLVRRGFEIERVKATWDPCFNWFTNIRSETRAPHGGVKLLRISQLGKPGAIPLVKISEPDIAHESRKSGR